MLAFLLKSTACLIIFLVFYKLILEKESVHHFKRYFLLAALVTSFIIPNLVFIEYIDAVEPTASSIVPSTAPISDDLAVETIPQASIFDWQLLLWMIYGFGVLGFGLRFMANILRIRLRIKRNSKFKDNFATKVLLKQTLPPHTFLNYIFLNQKQFEENSIPQQVLLHEETHAKQRHSLDIIFMELAQVILWFNPLIYLFKSSIKLNHEFLADNAVINKDHDHSQYQNTLLSYLSNGIENHQSVGIANAINYSSIKKRFTVMKTNTSKTSFVLRSLLLLPLTALLLFGFSEHRQVERRVSTDHTIKINLLSDEDVEIDNYVVHFNEVAQLLTQKYLSHYDSEKTKVEINVSQPIHLNTINNLSEEIKTTGIEAIKVFADEVIMEESQLQDNVPVTSSTTMLNAKQMTIVGFDDEVRPQEQQSATREEMKEYNALAKKYNAMDRNHMVIKKSEVMRLKEIYGKMSEKQRNDAEPFPDFPPPPPAPPAIGEPEPPMPPSTVKSVKPAKPIAPPSPPVPPTPLEHIKKMAAKGATFMFNGKEITAKKAIEIVQNNDKINIDSRASKDKTPIVKLSTDPIEVEN